jgi:hypothetical protein
VARIFSRPLSSMVYTSVASMVYLSAVSMAYKLL